MALPTFHLPRGNTVTKQEAIDAYKQAAAAAMAEAKRAGRWDKNTTCCFTALDPFAAATTGFTVQVVGIDPDGTGTYHSTLKDAFEYAAKANGNGFSCFVHLA